MLTLFFCTRLPPPNSHLKPLGRCPISAPHFSTKVASFAVVKTTAVVQEVLNLTPLNPTPATCHKRKREFHCSFRKVALQKLHCNICLSAARKSFLPKAALQQAKNCSATLKKLHCRTFALSCCFPADFKLPCLGTHVYCLRPEGRSPRVGTPSGGIRGKRDLLEASEWPTLLARSVENGHPSPRPLKNCPGAPESLSGALRGPWEGVSETPGC